MAYDESKRANAGQKKADFYKEALKESLAFREEYKKRLGTVRAEDMFWEDSPQGKIKHVINEMEKNDELVVSGIGLDLTNKPPGTIEWE